MSKSSSFVSQYSSSFLIFLLCVRVYSCRGEIGYRIYTLAIHALSHHFMLQKAARSPRSCRMVQSLSSHFVFSNVAEVAIGTLRSVCSLLGISLHSWQRYLATALPQRVARQVDLAEYNRVRLRISAGGVILFLCVRLLSLPFFPHALSNVLYRLS